MDCQPHKSGDLHGQSTKLPGGFMYGEWIKCTDREPHLSDRSVLMHFANGSIETVHVEDFFKPITNGVRDGVQQYTKWFINHDPACTHWMELPDAPGNSGVYQDGERR